MQRFWSATRGRWVDWATRDEVSRFDGLLDQAVARCLLPGRAGVFLSGGLDSVSVAAVASDLAAKGEGPPVTALSLAFPTPETDEVSIQRAVAEALGMEQRMVPFAEAAGLRGILQESLALSAAWPVPLLNLWLPAYLELGRRGREVGCTALLTGGGGDEWLSVTPYLAADLLRDLDLAGLARLHRQFVRSYDRPRLALLRANLWTFGLRPLLRETATQWTRLGVPRLNRWRRRRAIERNWPEWLAPDPRFRKLLVERELADEPATPRSFYVDQMRSAFDHPVVCVEMEEVFETGRRLGAFMFQPYWDADLVEFLFRVPPTLLNRDDRAKGIVRPLLEKRFPSLGFHRHKKREATTLVDHLVATEGLTAWQTLGGPAALADAGIVDFSKLQATMNQALHARPIQRAAFVWHAATLESWLRRHA
jgi:asparagine synthetase B (glutamine-hydrolysing)